MNEIIKSICVVIITLSLLAAIFVHNIGVIELENSGWWAAGAIFSVVYAAGFFANERDDND